MSAFPSGNQSVRLAIIIGIFRTMDRMADRRSFGGQRSNTSSTGIRLPCLAIAALRFADPFDSRGPSPIIRCGAAFCNP
jgi:hypothetical protein